MTLANKNHAGVWTAMDWEIEVIHSVDERIERDGYPSLSEPERHYHGVWWLLFVSYGSGLVQYFQDAPTEWVVAAREGLKAVGATSMANLLDDAIALLPHGRIPPDEDSRESLLAVLTEGETDEIDSISDRFTSESYPEDLLSRFVNHHDSEFLGPRTAMALWKSKVDRGVDTTPQYVTKTMDFDKEAEKDRPHSSRSCPSCGYPTPDYRPRCKRCDCPHGRA